MEQIYSLIDVKQAYNGTPVLDIPRLSIAPRSIVGIVGPNGSGKTTLIRLLAFLDRPKQGDIFFKGKSLAQNSLASLRQGITLLTQEPYLLHRSVFDNVAYGLRIRGEKNYRETVNRALELVGLNPVIFSSRQWYELSGGEAQRVALAARLAMNPEVLLMDEPTASLDEKSADRIKEAVLAARLHSGSTLVIISHDKSWLNSVCDRMIEMRQGHVIGE